MDFKFKQLIYKFIDQNYEFNYDHFLELKTLTKDGYVIGIDNVYDDIRNVFSLSHSYTRMIFSEWVDMNQNIHRETIREKFIGLYGTDYGFDEMIDAGSDMLYKSRLMQYKRKDLMTNMKFKDFSNYDSDY